MIEVTTAMPSAAADQPRSVQCWRANSIGSTDAGSGARSIRGPVRDSVRGSVRGSGAVMAVTDAVAVMKSSWSLPDCGDVLLAM